MRAGFEVKIERAKRGGFNVLFRLSPRDAFSVWQWQRLESDARKLVAGMLKRGVFFRF